MAASHGAARGGLSKYTTVDPRLPDGAAVDPSSSPTASALSAGFSPSAFDASSLCGRRHAGLPSCRRRRPSDTLPSCGCSPWVLCCCRGGWRRNLAALCPRPPFAVNSGTVARPSPGAMLLPATVGVPFSPPLVACCRLPRVDSSPRGGGGDPRESRRCAHPRAPRPSSAPLWHSSSSSMALAAVSRR